MKVFVLTCFLFLVLCYCKDYTLLPTKCIEKYDNQTICTQDCICGWCISSKLCLNGFENGPSGYDSNKGEKCANIVWIFSAKCKRKNNFLNILYWIVGIFGIVIGFGCYLAAKLDKENGHEGKIFPNYYAL